MKVVMLAIFDVMAGGYVGSPMCAPTRGVGERSFVDVVNDPQAPFIKHPDDYELHELGEWDQITGELFPVSGRPVVYGRARQFLRGGEDVR